MVGRLGVLFVALLLVVARPIEAHPLHSSLTEIRRERNGTVTVSIRLFADDFGRTLELLAASPSAVGVSREILARRYFERSVNLIGRNGRHVPLIWCGMNTTEGLTWLCARSVDPVPDGKLRFSNTLMFDRFSDQISIVRWTHRAKVKTLVLSARAAEGLLD